MDTGSLLGQFLIAIVVTPILDVAFVYLRRPEMRRLISALVAAAVGVGAAFALQDNPSQDDVITNVLVMYGQIQAIYQISRASGASGRLRDSVERRRIGAQELPF